MISTGTEFTIEENLSAGTPIGAPLQATDVEGETLIDWRIEGNDFGNFEIDPSTGQISVKAGANIDVDVLPPAEPFFDIFVTVTDGTAPDDSDRSAAELVRIYITDLNDTAPNVSAAGPFQIIEGSAVGTVLAANLTASDVDTTGNIVAWEIESGDDEGVENDDLTDPTSSSISYTFTVRNHGNVDLTLDGNNILLPTGYQFSGYTPDNVVEPGTTALFILTFTASTVGSFNDTVEIPSDDNDDNPFKINLSVAVEPANGPPVVTNSPAISVPAPVVLGSYLGRVPAYDPDGDEVEFSLSGGGSLPDGLVSVDPDTGDLYLADIELLPLAGIGGTLAFSVREVSTNLTTSGSISLSLPGRKAVLGDDFRDSASHRDEIAFDLRPASVSADGEALFTTLMIGGLPLALGQSLDDDAGGFIYGTYHVGMDGVLRYKPNSSLYEQRQNEFIESTTTGAAPGMTFLERPEVTVALVASNGSRGPAGSATASATDLNVLATRTSTPTLQNTQPVSIATGEASGILSTLPMMATLGDLFSIDLSQWFIDPDGDDIYATNAQPTSVGGAQLSIDLDPSAPEQVQVDITGFDTGANFIWDSETIRISVGDHPNLNADERLELTFLDFDDDLPRYDMPAGITHATAIERNDIDGIAGNGPRIVGSQAWRDRWNAWQVETTTHSTGTDDSPSFNVGGASIDLATGQATIGQSLNLQDAFDDVSVPLPGLIYTGNNVNNATFAHLVVHRPSDEARKITRFDVTVELYDHFANDVGATPTSATYQLNVDAAEQSSDRFSLVVPVVEDKADIFDSGVIRYRVRLEPVFDTAASTIAEDPISLTSTSTLR